MTGDQLKEIRQFAKKRMTKTHDPFHDFSHIERVRKNALKISKILKVDKRIDLNLLQTACLLHDLTYTRYEPGVINFFFEGKHMRKMGLEILDDFNIDNREKTILMEAFLRHTHWFIFRGLFKVKIKASIYTQILHDADKIDIFSKKRWERLREDKQKYFFYKLSWLLILIFVRLGKNNKGVFLNFPQVAKAFDND